MSMMEPVNTPHLREDCERVQVPEGSFLMGSSVEQVLEVFRATQGVVSLSWFDREIPRRNVHLQAFEMDKYPVTCTRYARFCQETGYAPPWYWRNRMPPPELADHPVSCVSLKDAKAFCQWAGGRLPYESEWEKAARGSQGYLYPWGNKFEASRANAHREAGQRASEPVGSRPTGTSPYGVADMAGNVMEWTCDHLVPYPGHKKQNWPEWTSSLHHDFDTVDYAGRPLQSSGSFSAGDSLCSTAHAAFSLEMVVVRGGSYLSLEEFCRCSARVGVLHNAKLPELGFRCVYGPDPYAEGERLLSRGLVEEALEQFHKGLQLSPHNPALLVSCARANEKIGNTARALELWRTLLGFWPEHREAKTAVERHARKTALPPRPDAGPLAPNSEASAALVFGPRYSETLSVLGSQLSQQGITLYYADRADSLNFPAARLMPCTLVFSHYVPNCLGQYTPREEFERWKRCLLDSPGLAAHQFSGARYRWVCNEANGDATLVVYWPCIEALHCQAYATALEKAFMRWGGNRTPTDQPL